MKIALISSNGFTNYTFRLELMKALRAKGHEVITMSSPDDYAPKIESEGFRFIPIALERRGTNPLKDIRLMFQLYRIYRQEKIDLNIHFTIKPAIYGSIASKLAGIKSIAVQTGFGYTMIKKNFLTSIVKKLYKISLRYPEKILFINPEDMEYFVNDGLCDRSKAGVIKSEGVNSEAFKPDFCTNVEKPENKIIFLLMGRMLLDKGVGEFAEAAKKVKSQYKDAEFWLLGDIDKGNPSVVEKKQIDEWQEKGFVTYLGKTYDVRPYICKADVIVLPSYREGAGMVLLEGMAMEKPVIATDTAGCRMVCKDGYNGFLIPVKDAEALADAMIKIIKMDKEKLRDMGRRGRELVLKEFDVRIINKTYFELIEEILKK
jgi:glycosyltransferase involved in cell wall biosynthesis